MPYGLILSDAWNLYPNYRIGIKRNTSVHRTANFLRENNIEVDVIDFMHDISVEEFNLIFKCMATRVPTFIAINTSLDKKYARWEELVQTIKHFFPKTKIIAFGERVLRPGYTNIDYYIEGYVESAFLATIEYIIGSRNSIISSDVQGCTLIRADDYPNDMKKNSFSCKYLESDFIDKKEHQPVLFSNGCIFKCAFCNHSLTGTKKGNFEKSAEVIKEEMLYSYNKWGITKFTICDSTFNESNEKVNLLLEISKLIPERIQITGFLRLDVMYKQQSLDRLIEAGFISGHFGLDSLHGPTGKIIGKVVDPDILKQYLIDIKQKYPEFFPYGTFIIGLPQDSIENQYKTLDWIMETKVLGGWHFFPLSIKENPNTESGEPISPMDADYEQYGYKKQQGKIDFDFSTVGRANRDRNFIPLVWENSDSNLYKAIEVSKDINNKSRAIAKTNPWLSFDASVVYKDLDWWMSNKPTDDDFVLVRRNTEQFVTNYKTKKLEYFLSF
jgi:hypothetical protein